MIIQLLDAWLQRCGVCGPRRCGRNAAGRAVSTGLQAGDDLGLLSPRAEPTELGRDHTGLRFRLPPLRPASRGGVEDRVPERGDARSAAMPGLPGSWPPAMGIGFRRNRCTMGRNRRFDGVRAAAFKLIRLALNVHPDFSTPPSQLGEHRGFLDQHDHGILIPRWSSCLRILGSEGLASETQRCPARRDAPWLACSCVPSSSANTLVSSPMRSRADRCRSRGRRQCAESGTCRAGIERRGRLSPPMQAAPIAEGEARTGS